MVQRLFFDIMKQRDHKYATPPPWKQFYVFLATAPTGVLTAGTAGLLWKANLWERCCTFMEKRRRCTIAGITAHFTPYSAIDICEICKHPNSQQRFLKDGFLIINLHIQVRPWRQSPLHKKWKGIKKIFWFKQCSPQKNPGILEFLTLPSPW